MLQRNKADTKSDLAGGKNPARRESEPRAASRGQQAAGSKPDGQKGV